MLAAAAALCLGATAQAGQNAPAAPASPAGQPAAPAGPAPAGPATATAAPGHPFSLDASAIVDTLAVVVGGREHGGRVLARGDLVAGYDGTDHGLAWLSARLDLTATSGNSISALAGDVQGLSSIEFPSALRVTEAWLQASGRHASLKVGVIDSNIDFDEQHVGALFVNSSHGSGPDLSLAGLDGAGATPDTTLGVVAAVFDAEAGWKFRAGLFNGRPGDPQHPGQPSFVFNRDIGVLAIGEADWVSERTRVAIGSWHFTSKLPALDGSGDRRGASGAYATVETTLVRREDGLQVQTWLRAGAGDARTDRISRYFGGGIVASGLSRAWPEDTAGLAVAHARLNRRLGAEAGAETAIEVTLQHRLNGWLTVQPELQWLINPGGLGGVGNAVVGGLRLILTRSVF